jgi:predicted O-methyltransferase YrrM
MSEQSFTEYIEGLFGGETPEFSAMRRNAAAAGLPSIQVPFELGRLLQFFIRLSGARRVLEIGTLFGYSATLMARALPDSGTILTLEADEKHARIARENFANSGLGDRVEVREGPALKSLPALQGEHFDLVFIDADKDTYPAYLDWALRLTQPGAVIMADNVWRGGSVLDPQGDAGAQALQEFNRRVAAEPRLFTIFVPTRNGGDAASASLVLAT